LDVSTTICIRTSTSKIKDDIIRRISKTRRDVVVVVVEASPGRGEGRGEREVSSRDTAEKKGVISDSIDILGWDSGLDQ